MAKAKITPFRIWESANENGEEGRFARVSNSLMLHHATKNLTPLAFRVYVYMILEAGGQRDFEFPRVKWRGFISNGGFQKAKNELCEKGYIEVIFCGKITKEPNVYRFSSKWWTQNKT